MGRNQTDGSTESNLASSRPERISEYKWRKRSFDFVRVDSDQVEALKTEGWEFDRELATGIRLRREKAHDEVLENRFWSVLYLLGFEHLNVGRKFELQLTVESKKVVKEIAVLGIDDDTVVVAEFRSQDELKKKSLQGAIAELNSHKRAIANAVRALLADESNRKFIWCMVTSRIRWSDSDIESAKQNQIQVVREQELRYFLEIAKTLGPAAKHQFEAEFLAGQKIANFSNRRVAASRFKLGGRNAYYFTISAKELLRRSFVNHRDLRDPSGAPTYQRLINAKRIKGVASFLDSGGYFANSILINFRTPIRFEQQGRDEDGETRFGMLYLPDTYKSCWIIDGQHRLYGAALVDSETADPIIPVVAFEKLPPTEEATLFATINNEQRQVQKRLLDELDGELKWDSDNPEESAQAIAARALDQLQHEVSGPFEDRFAPPGVPATPRQVLTLPQVKQALVKSGLLGKRPSRDGSFVPGPLTSRSHKKTLENTADFLSAYFTALRNVNPTRWEAGPAHLLCYNPAIQAHIRLCGEIYRYLDTKNRIDQSELDAEELADAVIAFAKPVTEFIRSATDDEFKERFYVPFGSGGPARYFYRAADLIRQKHKDFEPEGLLDHLVGTNKDLKDTCDRLVGWITEAVHGFVVRKLREVHGDDFFEVGIRIKDIKKKAYEKSLDDPSGRKPLETYLDIVDLKRILEASENWPLFKDYLNSLLPGQPKGNNKNLTWLDKFNDVRKIMAHSYGRSYSDDDATLLKQIEAELRRRLV